MERLTIKDVDYKNIELRIKVFPSFKEGGVLIEINFPARSIGPLRDHFNLSSNIVFNDAVDRDLAFIKALEKELDYNLENGKTSYLKDILSSIRRRLEDGKDQTID